MHNAQLVHKHFCVKQRHVPTVLPFPPPVCIVGELCEVNDEASVWEAAEDLKTKCAIEGAVAEETAAKGY